MKTTSPSRTRTTRLGAHAIRSSLRRNSSADRPSLPTSIWDWRDKTRLHRFANGVNSGTITSMYFINEVSEAILLTGTCACSCSFRVDTSLDLSALAAEGNVRLWRKYESANELEIASAFRAVTTTTPSSQPAGLITDWNQQAGHLYISGDTTYVRIWDAHRELPHAVHCPPSPLLLFPSCLTLLSSAGHSYSSRQLRDDALGRTRRWWNHLCGRLRRWQRSRI